jgi:hypothetical protein
MINNKDKRGAMGLPTNKISLQRINYLENYEKVLSGIFCGEVGAMFRIKVSDFRILCSNSLFPCWKASFEGAMNMPIQSKSR